MKQSSDYPQTYKVYQCNSKGVKEMNTGLRRKQWERLCSQTSEVIWYARQQNGKITEDKYSHLLKETVFKIKKLRIYIRSFSSPSRIELLLSG